MNLSFTENYCKKLMLCYHERVKQHFYLCYPAIPSITLPSESLKTPSDALALNHPSQPTSCQHLLYYSAIKR